MSLMIAITSWNLYMQPIVCSYQSCVSWIAVNVILHTVVMFLCIVILLSYDVPVLSRPGKAGSFWVLSTRGHMHPMLVIINTMFNTMTDGRPKCSHTLKYVTCFHSRNGIAAYKQCQGKKASIPVLPLLCTYKSEVMKDTFIFRKQRTKA
jgi:hypothetical protein